MSNGQWYPPEWPDRIRALAAGELTAVTPRRAATVMLLRDRVGADAGRGPVVHMLRRRASMAFAGGAYAYPGGGVDPRDDDRLIGWAGPSLESWAARLGVDTVTEAQAIVCAAVRETYEEAGVLLAGPTRDTVVGDVTGADWEADREALVARELSFAEFLDRRGLVLRSDLLGAWARWITPAFEPRRYDTWFFVAALPDGQRTRNASTEADRTVWISPGEAADGYDRGELLMMPPTVSTLRTLRPYGTSAEALEAADSQDLAPVLAQARLEGDELVLSWPGHDEFTKHIPGAGASAGVGSGAAPDSREGGEPASGPASGAGGGAA
ncbi:NUDIX hydrolase [Streptomyces sp. NBC_01433]|uniref:NUDIX hydrolase n=1 Tax=Streptomyces sp. NBC_01433 TaxID=2903864 RepID=UPI002254E7F7|nr:NUDIX hydrolase [Streptomyces sp. NBC_01433]MCX4676134.1 NUDIX hydrolase [Streptomyces sp. NBC_01433]